MQIVAAGLVLRFLPIFTDFYRFLPIFRTFLGDFSPQKLPSRRFQTLWEWLIVGARGPARHAERVQALGKLAGGRFLERLRLAWLGLPHR